MPNMIGPHSYGQFSVVIANDGAINVKSGDTISGYSAAMYQVDPVKTRDYWGEFGKMQGSEPQPLADPNVIQANSTIYHIPTFREQFSPLPLRSLPERLEQIISLMPRQKIHTIRMIKKSITLLNSRTGSGFEDSYHGSVSAFTAANYGNYKKPFDYDFAEAALDRSANHVLKKIEKLGDELGDDTEFAASLARLGDDIATHVSAIRSKTKGGLNKSTPRRAAVDAWMVKRVDDSACILNCYRKVWYGK